jgi:hypothetical protein
MSEYFHFSSNGEYNYPVKNYINNNWEDGVYFFDKVLGLEYNEYRKNINNYEKLKQTFRNNAQSNKFKDSKLTKIKLSKPLNNKGVWLSNGGDEYIYGLFIKKEIYDKVFSKYLKLVKTIPLVYGKEEELQGYMITPYYGFEQNNDLDMNKSDIEYTYEKHLAGEKSGNYWHPTYIYQSSKLENKPLIFNYRWYSEDYGIMASFDQLVFHESIAKELMAIGVKMKPLNMV